MKPWQIVAAVVALGLAHGAGAADAPKPKPQERAVDRLQLDTTAITGNRELP
jgi:hypothetical protein